MSKVSIVKCENYTPSEVETAVSKSLELIGGIKNFIKPNTTVLLKVNALSGVEPEKAVTTHPEVVVAVAKEVLKAGATPVAGDCFGDASAKFEHVFEKIGVKKALEKINVKTINLDSEGIEKIESDTPKINPIHISKVVSNVDAVINICKLKTHELTLMTCAIKNMFGIIPGFNKGKYHALTPKLDEFANTLVEVFRAKIPNLNIVDGVIGMEGHGPMMGLPRKIGLIIASSDAVALDSVCSKIIGFDPKEIKTTVIANKKGLGEIDLEKIELVGEPLTPIKDYKKFYSTFEKFEKMPPFMFKLAKPIFSLMKLKPKINRKKCTKCMVCVNNCPVEAIDSKSFKTDYKKCIMCFCCRELCRYDAVELKKTFLLELAQNIKKLFKK